MPHRRLLGTALVVVGLLALLARAAGSTGWLWLALVAAAALYAFARTRTYAFVLLGGVLSGSAVGILLADLGGCDGVFLVSLGVGLLAVDRVEPRPQRWATALGAVLVAIGAVVGLADGGAFGAFWLPVLLVAAGVLLLWREHGAGPRFPPPLRPLDAQRSGAREEAPTRGERGPR